jgi:DNA-binding LacI/PurR family transcriptional regulator
MAQSERREKVGNKPATMADVAKLVGVSRQLVGMVFSGRGGVGSDTEARIRQAAKEIGYRPNRAAQSLRSVSTKYVGLVFHPAESSMTELLPALYNEAKAANLDLILSAVSEDHDEIAAIDGLLGHRCNGLILIASQLSLSRLQKLARETPLVSIGRRVEKVRCGVVSSHGEVGVDAAVEHLVQLGHREISYVVGPDMLDAEYRLAGYRKAMKRHALSLDEISLAGDFAERGGAAAADKLLARKRLPTAVICNNDQSAMGLVHRLQQDGIRVPKDVSVIGYDDTVAKYPYLSFTTVRQDPRELAAAAIMDISERISGTKYLSQTYLTSSTLVVRASTSKPKR